MVYQCSTSATLQYQKVVPDWCYGSATIVHYVFVTIERVKAERDFDHMDDMQGKQRMPFVPLPLPAKGILVVLHECTKGYLADARTSRGRAKKKISS